MQTTFRPLDQGTCFIGKVRFRNLHKDELGLLLWSIQLDKNSWMNVGKAKAFGYGNISVDITSAKQVNIQNAYATKGLLDLNPWEDIDILQMIQLYKDTINSKLGETKIEHLSHIKDFFAMKNPDLIPENEFIRYMDIERKEYQNRRLPLPIVEEVIKNSQNEV